MTPSGESDRDKALAIWAEVDGLESSVTVEWAHESQPDAGARYYAIRVPVRQDLDLGSLGSIIRTAEKYNAHLTVEEGCMVIRP
jgi:hypothetical protein